MTDRSGRLHSGNAAHSNDAHNFSDVDDSPESQHHTLGSGAQQAAPGSIIFGPWLDLVQAGGSLAAGVGGFGFGWAGLAIRKNGLGDVECRGMLAVPAIGVAGLVFTLPLGYAPTVVENRSAMANNAWNSLDINVNGTVLTRPGFGAGFLNVCGMRWSIK